MPYTMNEYGETFLWTDDSTEPIMIDELPDYDIDQELWADITG